VYPRVTRFDFRNLEAGGTSACHVNSIRRNNTTELGEVRTELERRLAHLVVEELQVLVPILYEYLDLRSCTQGCRNKSIFK